jgi:hypothetical protein
MKYAKELDKLPLTDRIMCVSYRKWKKVKAPGKYWKMRLFLEFMMTPMRLIDTNMKTLYKICKRFEKRYSVTDERDFYTRVSKRFYPDTLLSPSV